MEQFTEFLKNRGAYDSFCDNLFFETELTIDELLTDSSKGEWSSLIIGSFVWSDTNQGLVFWRNLDAEWKDKSKKVMGLE